MCTLTEEQKKTMTKDEILEFVEKENLIRRTEERAKYRFSWAQAFSNGDTGKTSANKVAGLSIIFVCLLAFIVAIVSAFIDVEYVDNLLKIFDSSIVSYLLLFAAGSFGIKTISGAVGQFAKKK